MREQRPRVARFIQAASRDRNTEKFAAKGTISHSHNKHANVGPTNQPNARRRYGDNGTENSWDRDQDKADNKINESHGLQRGQFHHKKWREMICSPILEPDLDGGVVI